MSELSAAATAANFSRADERRRLILAAAIPLAAFGLQWLFWTVIEPFVWFLFFPAVFFSAWIGGRRGGLLATGLSAGLVWYFFIPPQLSLAFEHPSALFSSALFLVMGVLFSDFFERLKQANLRAVDARFRELFEQAAVGMTQTGLDGRLQRVNQRLCEILRYPREELLAKTLPDITHPDDLNTSRALMHQVLAGEIPTGTLELRCLRQDRSSVPVNLTVSLVRDTAGKPEHFIAVVEDITERKQAEEKSRAGEEKFSRLFHASPVAMSVTTINEGRYLDVNAEWLKVFGSSRDAVLGRTALELGVWVDPAQRAKVLAALQQHGSLRDFELQFRNQTGQIRQVLWSVEIVIIGTETCLMGAALDITERKLAQQKLTESEHRYRKLFEMESDALFLGDCATHQILDTNRAAQQLYGYTPEEFSRLKLEDVSAEPETSRESVDTQEGHIPLRWHRKKNGERFAVEITANTFEAEGRRLKLGAVRDITTRRQAEAALRDSEERYRQIFAVESDAILVVDRETLKFIDVNPAAEKMYGYRREEFLQLRATDISAEPAQTIGNINSDTTLTQQLRHRRKDGTIFPVEVSDGAFEFQGRLIKVGAMRDLTERKRAEEQAHIQFSALRAAANGILITDQAGTIEWINPAFAKLTGYSEAEAIGNNPRLLKSGRQAQDFYAKMWSTISTGNVWQGELVNKRKDGTLYTAELTITPVRGKDGRHAHFVAIHQDVTERLVLEQQLRQTQKLQAIGTLAGGIAHDFNNILGAIIAFTEVAKMDHRQDPELQENLGEALKASRRAVNLVKQILSFSQQQKLERRNLQLAPVVKEALKLLRATLPATIALEPVIAPNLPDVLADPTQIHQVMMNLCTNAAQAMRDRHGLLCVQLDKLHLPPDQPLPHPGLSAGVFVRLRISDTGHGMEAAIVERIFDPFFTTNEPGEGTGLGLSVVHGIVQEHEGVIAVESQPGCGTTFTIYLPARPVSENHEAETSRKITPGSGERILFVDDEAALGKVARQVFPQLGYQPLVFGNAEAAWAAFQENPAAYDLVITDLTMPSMTGVELAKKIHQLRPELPILLASGNPTALAPEELPALGILQVLNKPLEVEQLAAAIHKALRAPAAAA